MAEVECASKMKFNKTETEYNMKSIRFLLLTITTMFIIIGFLMIVLGINVYSHYHGFSFFYEGTKNGRIFTPSIMSVLLGMAVVVVSFVGFYGSLKRSTCMVNLYALILTLVLIVKLIVVILAFTLDSATISRYVDVPVREYSYDPEIRDEIDQLQLSLNCCGSDSYLDYVGMDFANLTTVSVIMDVEGDKIELMVPQSCCPSAKDGVCSRRAIKGCKDALVDVIYQNASVLGVLGVSVMFIQLMGILFALLLARCIRKMKSEQALITWKIKEQMILARMADARAKHVQEDAVYIAQPDSSVA